MLRPGEHLVRRAPIGALIVSFACVAIAAGCGGGEEEEQGEGGQASKTGYLAKVNRVCRQVNARIEAVFGKVDSERQAESAIAETLVPGIQRAVDTGRSGIPAGDEETVNGILDDTEAVLEAMKSDPSRFAAAEQSGSDPFADVNRRLNAYGLTECGGG